MAAVKPQTPNQRDDWIPPHPCLVCGVEFTSRRTLATHLHPKKKGTTR